MQEEAARARYTAALKAAAADAVAKGDPVMQAASALSRELGELHIATKVCSPIGQGGESPN